MRLLLSSVVTILLYSFSFAGVPGYLHHFEPGENRPDWELWKYSSGGSELIAADDKTTSLTLKPGLYLIDIYGGAVRRGDELLGKNLETGHEAETGFCAPPYGRENWVRDPFLLQVGTDRSILHGPEIEEIIYLRAEAGGTGSAHASAKVSIVGSPFEWEASVEFSDSGQNCWAIILTYLPGVTYKAIASADGYPCRRKNVGAQARYSFGGTSISCTNSCEPNYTTPTPSPTPVGTPGPTPTPTPTPSTCYDIVGPLSLPNVDSANMNEFIIY